MLKSVYQSAYGLNSAAFKQDLKANNLANVNTTGFKKDNAFYRTLQELENKKNGVPRWEDRSMTDQTYTDFSAGRFQMTDNSLDMALDGQGFFVIQTFAGERYTRNGNFSLNPDHLLVNDQNQPVMGENGPIRIDGKTVAIGENGQVVVDGAPVDRIRVVDFEKPYALNKIGNNLWAPQDALAVHQSSDARVKQGFLEDSNVNGIEEMVDMLELYRHYESGQKMIQSLDETLNTLVNQVGRLE
ncbi:MAG: flagellar basal-body rod protein FlgF [Candidatus Delongbacteria bacterium]|mgnify:CR=1 FL=1|nr:flagellar basal-body rod protein FlgF [Candidatus Delongbacteria bacterium]